MSSKRDAMAEDERLERLRHSAARVLAVAEGKWGLLAAMVPLALVSVGLFVVQWRLLRRLTAKHSEAER